MVFRSNISDVSSWDDCDSRTSWDVISSATGVRSVGGSEASSVGVAVIADLDAFTFSNDHSNGDREENREHCNDGVHGPAEDDDESDSVDLSTVSSTTSTAYCPLTLERFRHPYYCEVDHHLYEKKAILEWVRNNGTSPMTRQSVRLNQLRPHQPQDDDDDDDTNSVSTESGWPRPLTAFYHQKGQVVPRQPQTTSSHSAGNYRTALLIGGGGIQSEQALSLSKKRPIAIKPTQLKPPIQQQDQQQRKKLMSLYPLSKSTGVGGEEDEYDDGDYFYSEYQARKGALSRYQGRLILGGSMKGVRGRTKFNNLRDYLSQRDFHASGMDRIEESYDQDEDYFDNEEW